jgi:hypothetical protein
MRNANLLRKDGELYEVVKVFPIDRFKIRLEGESADIVKQWVGSEKILISKQTNEYLFVNLIEEAHLIEEQHDNQRTEESQSQEDGKTDCEGTAKKG